MSSTTKEGNNGSSANNSKSETTTPDSAAAAPATTTTTPAAAVDASVDNEDHLYYHEPAIPSMSLSIFVFWILPVIFLAIFARFAVDTTPPPIRQSPGSNIPIKFDAMPGKGPTTKKKKKKVKRDATTASPETRGVRSFPGGPRIVRPSAPSAIPTTSTRPTWPTSYKKVGYNVYPDIVWTDRFSRRLFLLKHRTLDGLFFQPHELFWMPFTQT